MKIVIPGGTGQVGTILARSFHREGHEVVVLSRNRASAPWRVERWDARNLGDWAAEFEGAGAVINLAGRSVNCRYNEANRREIVESRVDSTRVVGEAVARAARAPRVWLQMSTATIYAHRFDAPNDEAAGVIGGAEAGAPDTWRFSIDVAKSWERAANEADVSRTRRVLMRAAMVMSPDRGGVFDTLLALARRGLGGRAGDGRQYVSWIHEADFTRAVRWLIDRDDLAGPINLAAPHPLPNAEFMREMRAASGARVGLPASEWMLAVGALFLRTETELILKSRRVVPRRLLESGFAFDFPAWADAARDLCRRWREAKAGAG
ncbi:MAG TPA: TIGR01777 family oxidoreductase [Pyrinomonadaceae bacterium]|nr:TIGR01777 family oxidoreductase [Pyrinomonadaceae bacterium]